MNLWKRLILKLRGTKDNVDVSSTHSQPISDSPNFDISMVINSTPSYTIGDSPDFDISDERIKLLPKISAMEQWKSEVVPHERVIVLCFAIWSPPDNLFIQILIEVIPEFEEIKFWRVNIDDSLDESNPLIANLLNSWKICTTPTLILLKHGEKVADTTGYRRKEQLRTILKDWSEL